MSIHTVRHVYQFIFCLSLIALISACSTFPTSKPVAPDVKLLSVKPHKLGLVKQQLALQLQLSNPNTYDLALQSVTFVAKLNGEELAQGNSNAAVTLPAEGDAEIEVMVSTRMNRILGQLLMLASNPDNALDYDVSGFVKLANWPVRIPFNVEGQLDEKLRN